MDKLAVNGSELMVKEYEGQRVVTLWDIARLHNVDVRNIRMNFENCKHYLIESEDYFLLSKADKLVVNIIDNKEISYHALNRAKNIPIFTESGYLLMVKPMTDELSWQVQKQLIKSYFKLQEVKQIIQNQLTADKALETSQFLVQLANSAGVSPASQVLITKTIYRQAGIELPLEITTDAYFDKNQIAKKVGLFSTNGKPHGQALSAIMDSLDIPEDEKQTVWETTGNWSGTVVKYTESAINKVQKWLKDNNYPVKIQGNKKTFSVMYQ